MEIWFLYNGDEIPIEYKIEDKIKEIFNKFKKEMGLLDINLYFLYEGEKIDDEEIQINDLIEELNIEKKNIEIFVFNRNNIISIKYKINKNEKIIRIFGETFVRNNKEFCKIFYKNKKYDLFE